jgi:large subunit ribosomal protein L24
MVKIKVKKGDTVKVRRGKDRGKMAKVLRVWPQEGRLMVEGLNVVTKHVRPRKEGEKAARVQISAPLRIDNVQVVCGECGKATRVGIEQREGKRTRLCKKCGVALP